MNAGGEVRLVLPAAPGYVRLARLVVAGLAGLGGYRLDEVEDLRIAITEMCFVLLGDDPPGPALDLRIALDHDGISMEGTIERTHARFGTAPSPSELSAQLLATLVDEHSVTQDDRSVSFTLRRSHKA